MTYSKEEKAEYDKKRYQLNKEKKLEYNKKYREENKKYYKKYRELNREKQREYIRKWGAENREHTIEYKREYRDERKSYCIEYLGGKCVKCGTIHNLQFDHIKREGKKYTIGSRIHQDFTIIKEELDKCQLLCVDCHKVKTKSEWTILRGDA